MTPAQRIAQLEAEVAELRTFLPMLSRMAFWESWTTKSVPEHIFELEDILDAAAFLFQHASGSVGDERANAGLDRAHPEFRFANETVPAAQALQDAYNRRTSPWVAAS